MVQGSLKEIALWGANNPEEGQDQDHPPSCTQDPVTPWSTTFTISSSRNNNNRILLLLLLPPFPINKVREYDPTDQCWR